MRLSELKPEEPGQPWGDVCGSRREVPHWRQCVRLQAPHELACTEPSGLAQEIPEARRTWHLVLFPGAAVSKHTHGGFNSKTLSSSGSRGWKSGLKLSWAVLSLKALGKDLSSLLWSLVAPGLPWPQLRHPSVCLHLHMASSLCICVSVPQFPLLNSTPVALD